MEVKYKEVDCKDIDKFLDEIIDIYRDAKWTNYTNNIEMLKNAYKNSLCIVKAYIENELVGIIRVVGDGYSIIYIQDLIVREKYHRLGIGRELTKIVLNKYNNVYQKVLLTDITDKSMKFYESLGFKDSKKYECISYLKFN